MTDQVVEIYTDGACSGNPGPGGWGAVLRYGGVDKDICGGDPGPTTNNRMELTAPIKALESLKRPVTCGSTPTAPTSGTASRAGCRSGRRTAGWTSAKQPVKNADLWRELDEAAAKHDVEWHWVKGHAGHPENERADRLAVRGMEEALNPPR